MDDKNERLFQQLVFAAGELATVADQASVVLSDKFEDMCRPQIDNVRAILERCPAPTNWGGDWNDEDIDVTVFRTETQPANLGPVGVKIVHRPTGIGFSSLSKPNQLENREVAMKALRVAVKKEFERRSS